jgi:hypothetical protein
MAKPTNGKDTKKKRNTGKEELQAFLDATFGSVAKEIQEIQKIGNGDVSSAQPKQKQSITEIRRPFIGLLNEKENEDKKAETPAKESVHIAVETTNNIENREHNIENRGKESVNNIENVVNEMTNNIENRVFPPEAEGEKNPKIYVNDSETYDNTEEKTYKNYDNGSEIYVNHPKIYDNTEEEKTLFPGVLYEKEEHSEGTLCLDHTALMVSLNALRRRRDMKFSRTDCALIEALYKYGEVINSLIFHLSLYQFGEENGISNFSVCKASPKMSKSNMFEIYAPIQKSGTYIRLSKTYFYSPDRRIDRYKIFSSSIIQNNIDIFTLALCNSILPYGKITKQLKKQLAQAIETIRIKLPFSQKQAKIKIAARMLALLKILLGSASIQKPSSYISAILRKEGILNLLDRLTPEDIEEANVTALLMDRVFNGELDELSAEELSLLIGEPVKRQIGTEILYKQISMIINGMS